MGRTLTLVEARRLGAAIALAADIHKDDLYGGLPYIFHPLQVTKRLKDEDVTTQIVAILHDCLEDHPDARGRIEAFVTHEELEALQGVTRHYFEQETYNDFISRVLLNHVSCLVKLADLQRNSESPNKSEHQLKLAVERYIPAMARVMKALLEFERKLQVPA